MSYVYRYVNAMNEECIYVGKVSGSDMNALRSRHGQHKKDIWYERAGGEKNVFMEYIKLRTPADADIMETALIAFYNAHCESQLANKSKCWGSQSVVDLSKYDDKWTVYGATFRTPQLEEMQEAVKNAMIDAEHSFYNERSKNGFDKAIEAIAKELADKCSEIIKEEVGGIQKSWTATYGRPYLRRIMKLEDIDDYRQTAKADCQ